MGPDGGRWGRATSRLRVSEGPSGSALPSGKWKFLPVSLPSGKCPSSSSSGSKRSAGGSSTCSDLGPDTGHRTRPRGLARALRNLAPFRWGVRSCPTLKGGQPDTCSDLHFYNARTEALSVPQCLHSLRPAPLTVRTVSTDSRTNTISCHRTLFIWEVTRR